MPDLLAGTIIQANDTPPMVTNAQTGSFTFNSTTYGIDADSGTYVDCGAAFTACTTGRAIVGLVFGGVNNTASVNNVMSFVIRAGSTVGAGAVFLAADDTRAVYDAPGSVAGIAVGATFGVTGLTPGSVYNIRLEHRVTGGIATIYSRSVTVSPAP